MILIAVRTMIVVAMIVVITMIGVAMIAEITMVVEVTIAEITMTEEDMIAVILEMIGVMTDVTIAETWIEVAWIVGLIVKTEEMIVQDHAKDLASRSFIVKRISISKLSGTLF